MSKGQDNVATSRKVEVFRPGAFKAMNGQEYTFSEADVSAMVTNYDAAGAPAPVVVGHPKHDDPAFGWVQGFEVNADGTLVAEIGDLAPEFVSAVEDGRYRKISMKFFAPGASNNPVPGSYYPRHVGFLGGAAPAVSGLAPVEFAETDEADLIEIEFVEPAMEDVASLFRSVREFFIDKFSLEDADRAVPEYLIRWVDKAADEPANLSPGFTEPQQKEPAMSGDDTKNAARAADLDKRERALANKENLAFADDLVEKGKLLPAQKSRVVALLDDLSAGEETEISFSDDGADKKIGAAQLFKDILSAQPDAIAFGAHDLGEEPGSAGAIAFAADGLDVDAADLALHQKATAYQTQNPGTDYLVAVQAVGGN